MLGAIPPGPGAIKIPTLYDISGSAHWFNAIDNGFTVYIDPETGLATIIAQKIRRKRTGRVGEIGFKYDVPTGRYTQATQPEFYRTGRPKAQAQDKPKQSPKSTKAPPVGPDGETLPF